jgi:dihydroorotate dehydrogenase electron transfer subunit
MATPTDDRPQARLFDAVVIENTRLCRDYHRVVLEAPGRIEARAGQFLHVDFPHDPVQVAPRVVEWDDAHPPRLCGVEIAGRVPVLRRPLSIARTSLSAGGRREPADSTDAGEALRIPPVTDGLGPPARDSTRFELIVKRTGLFTGLFWDCKVGDRFSCMGPLGRRFDLFPDRTSLLVGGGVGMAPMVFLAQELAAAGLPALAFVGGQARDMLPMVLTCPQSEFAALDRPNLFVEEFARFGVKACVSTDNGEVGFKGLVTALLRRHLRQTRPDPARTVVYTCGPEGMMRGVGAIAAEFGIRCQVSMERRMACAVGACQSCAAHTTEGFKLVCKQGPVFEAQEMVWGK